MPKAPDHTGRLVARRYRLQAVIGEGGFGRVYRACDERLDTQVAVKVINPWWAQDPEWVERFAQEARTAAGIGHPGVVRATDTGTDPEVGPYQVSELVNGESLRALLDREGPLDPVRAADLVAQAADALAAAHDMGVVHRDVKPGNLLLGRDGRVRVCDFGIARLHTGATRSSASHTLVGTPAYMAPEQARGNAAGPAADQYALGVVLFELLSGCVPFEGDTPVSIALAHLSDDVPDPPDGTPPAIRDALRRALAKDPGDRHHDARALAHALRADSGTSATAPIGSEHPTRRAPRRPRQPTTAATDVARGRPSRKPALVTAAVAALALIAAGTVLVAAGGEDPDAGASDGRARLAENGAGSSATTDAPSPPVAPKPVMATIPNVKGLSQGGARARIERKGLAFESVRRDSVRQSAGRVVSQRPAAGARLEEGETVQVTVSDGPPPVEVPDLEDSGTSAAQAALGRAGLTLGGTRAVPSGRPAGTVIRTEPAGGASVARGTAITLIVARAKAWRTVEAYELTADGSTPSFTVTGSKWRFTYTRSVCEYTCGFLEIKGGTYEQVSMAEGTHTTYGPGGRGTYRISSNSVGTDAYDLAIAVEQYS